VRQHQQAKARDAEGDDLTGPQFEGEKRASVMPYGAITAARLEGSGRGRKLVIDTDGTQMHLRYAAKLWPDEDATAFLGEHLGDRFTRAAA
jgi:hypothetical protein